SLTPNRMATATARGPSANQVCEAASAAVAAHEIDEKASAKVATRDEVWRRRNWLRRACTRKHNWISVAAAAAISTPAPATSAAHGEAKPSAATSGAKMTAMAIITASILAQIRLRAEIGAVATRSGASS